MADWIISSNKRLRRHAFQQVVKIPSIVLIYRVAQCILLNSLLFLLRLPQDLPGLLAYVRICNKLLKNEIVFAL